ncbi:unnamed protein product [Tetraodon nigroviridis]|uniref:(spotted green pufferfish) hypothetical protein n=1 Tax=Tetraodon nigroviridis TaxID=99883 RepID=Q4SC72_TETNG|nr:unnamed protein product [Tetraodon nigroviridis]
MILEMPGQLSRLKSRRRRPSSEVRRPRKMSARRKRPAKRPKTSPAPAESGNASAHQEGGSPVGCECQQAEGRTRCSASPGPGGREGKENKDWDVCGEDKQPALGTERQDGRGPFFPDDDSNQILPVEHFFGNMDIVQDVPQREPKTSVHAHRESRRRNFYAREDSDDEAAEDFRDP